MTISNQTRNSVLATRASVADTPSSRARGLLGRAGLSPGEALVIRPCASVHMLFMRFPIDVVFLGRDNRAVGCCRALRPYQFSPVFFKAACAVELPSGTLAATGTVVGDMIALRGQA